MVSRPISRLLAFLLLLMPLAAHAESMTVAVLYPELGGAYSRVFDSIISGIRDENGVEVSTLVLEGEPTVAAVERQVAERGADAVIALGHMGYALAKELELDIPVVVGATLMAPNGIAGISLAANPEQFFKRLGDLTPPVRRVFMVYSPASSGWLIPLADDAARRYGVELHAYEAGDMRVAARRYRDVLEEVRDLQDAIWLPLDSVTPDKAILPLVLDAAWKKRLVVFSNNPSHVEKGALFSLYPDHRGMGRRLAQMVMELSQARMPAPQVEPLNDLKLAVNVRTASHLGVLYSPRQRRDFSLVFPAR